MLEIERRGQRKTEQPGPKEVAENSNYLEALGGALNSIECTTQGPVGDGVPSGPACICNGIICAAR